MEDDDVTLSPETMQALQEFLQEKKQKEEQAAHIFKT